MARVLHLFRAPMRGAAMEELAEAKVLRNAGLVGCAHARPDGNRQLLLVDVETLRKFALQPGMIRENITTEGLDVNGLAIGQKLRVGELQLVVSLVCEPCEQIAAIRSGLQEAMLGQRGMLCRVLGGGLVKVGDEIAAV